MSYMWNEFNIKTFPSETIVFRDGVFCADLSTISLADINKKYNLPVHIIYVGEIAEKKQLDININCDNQSVFLSVDIKNKKPAFFNIFIKNTGKHSELRGHIRMNNFNSLVYRCIAEHLSANTGILLQNKLIAEKNTTSELSGIAKIQKNAGNCRSNIEFSAMADKSAKIEFLPAQCIGAIPAFAGHSAALFTPNDAQILYLRESGLSGVEVNDAMREAFMNSFNLF